MADGCHIENRLLAISPRFFVRLTPNFVWRSRITFRHRSRDQNTNYWKFKMADGRHFENGFIAISQPVINYPISKKFGVHTQILVPRKVTCWFIKNMKFKMADSGHIENCILAISQRCIVQLTWNLIERNGITFRFRSHDQNTKI